MSDYFGALLRSAGALPGSRQARGAVPEPEQRGVAGERAPVADMALEQVVEVETRPVVAAPSLARIPAAAPRSPDASTGSSSDRRPEASPAAAPAALPAAMREVHSDELAPAPADGPVHPLVRAALQWVRGDASADEARAPAPTPGQPMHRVADPAPPTAPASSLPVAMRTPMRDRTPPRAHAAPTQPAHAEASPGVGAADPSFDFELPRPVPLANTAGRAATGERPAVPAPPRVEVSIGTIHVSVDAPPAPRPLVQVVPPAPKPPIVSRPSTRSSLSRSRLPRF